MLDQLVNSTFLYSLTITLFHFLWQGALVGLALKCALMFVPLTKAQLRYAMSSIAMLANLFLPLITFFLIYHSNPLQGTASVESLRINEFTANLSGNLNSVWPSSFTEYSVYISIFWLTTVAFLASKLLIELYSVNQLPKRGTTTASNELLARFAQLVNRIGLKRKPQLLISIKVKVPMALGWLKPVVLIPTSMVTGLTPAQLDMLILHELAHIRRHDYLVNFLQTLVEILLFFHPCVHWVSKQMRNEREYCSDDIAVHHCGDPIAYAHTLADTATLCKSHRHLSIPNIALAATGGDLKQRVVRLVDHHCTSENQSGKWFASLAIVSAISIGTLNQFLAIPTFDISSGQLSLTQSPEDIINGNKLEYVNEPLPSSSLAQHLLIEKEKSNEALAVKVVNKDTLPVAKNNQKQEASSFNQNLAPLKHIQDLTTKPSNASSKLATSLVAQEQQKFSSKVKKEKQLTTKSPIENISVQKQVIIENTPSISAKAFERTDSSKSTTTYNPYAEQIASLENNPVSHDLNIKTNSANMPVQFFEPELVNTSISIDETVAELNNNRTAQLIDSVEPKYPAAAKRRGVELDVMVHFTIDKSGHVKDILFERKNKVNYFKTTIRNAVSKWRFLPAEENGKPVESRISKIFSFNLLK